MIVQTEKGVLTGLTEISDVVSYKTVAGRKIPSEGSLYYQGRRTLTTLLPDSAI